LQVQRANFTDLISEQAWWIRSRWSLAGQIVLIWSLLAAILIVANVEAPRLLSWRRAGRWVP
jgi:hypothetical protein